MAAKHSLETGHTFTRDETFAAACITLGLELKEGTPGIDNVYDKARPFRDSGGGHYAGAVTYYLGLIGREGITAGGLLKYWEDPAEVEREMVEFPLRLAMADTAQARKTAADDLKQLIPCAAMLWMRKAAKETPRGVWGRYPEPDGAMMEAVRKLDAIPLRIMASEAVPRACITDLKLCFPAAMQAYVLTFFANCCDLEAARRGVVPAIKIERPNLPSIPFVTPMSRGWKERMAKLNPLGPKKRR